MNRSYLARLAFEEVHVLIVALWLGALWPQVAPLAVVSGMTSEQVEAILGKTAICTFTGTITGGRLTMTYPNWRVSVCYSDGKVASVIRHKK